MDKDIVKSVQFISFLLLIPCQDSAILHLLT